MESCDGRHRKWSGERLNYLKRILRILVFKILWFIFSLIFVSIPCTFALKVMLSSGGFCAKGEELAVCDNGGDWKGRGWKHGKNCQNKISKLWECTHTEISCFMRERLLFEQAGLLLYGGFDNTLAALGDCWRIDLASQPPTWIRSQNMGDANTACWLKLTWD